MKGGKVACAAGGKDLDCPVGGTAHRDPEPQKTQIRERSITGQETEKKKIFFRHILW